MADPDLTFHFDVDPDLNFDSVQRPFLKEHFN